MSRNDCRWSSVKRPAQKLLFGQARLDPVETAGLETVTMSMIEKLPETAISRWLKSAEEREIEEPAAGHGVWSRWRRASRGGTGPFACRRYARNGSRGRTRTWGSGLDHRPGRVQWQTRKCR